MTNEEKREVLIKRTKALAWSAATMLAAMVVDFAAVNLELFNLPNGVTVFLGLVLAQITKYLNTK
jgi:hypothetical protein